MTGFETVNLHRHTRPARQLLCCCTCDVSGATRKGLMDSARHVIKRILNPRFLT